MQSMSSRDNVNKIFTKYDSSSLQTCPSNHLTSFKGDIKYLIDMRGCEMAMINKYKYLMHFHWCSWIREIRLFDGTLHNIFFVCRILSDAYLQTYTVAFSLSVSPLCFVLGVSSWSNLLDGPWRILFTFDKHKSIHYIISHVSYSL